MVIRTIRPVRMKRMIQMITPTKKPMRMSRANENETAIVQSTMISRQQSSESTRISSRKPLVMLIIENIGFSSSGLGKQRLNAVLLESAKSKISDFEKIELTSCKLQLQSYNFKVTRFV